MINNSGQIGEFFKEENRQLLDLIEILQIRLEKQFLQIKKLEEDKKTDDKNNLTTCDLANILIENEKLKTKNIAISKILLAEKNQTSNNKNSVLNIKTIMDSIKSNNKNLLYTRDKKGFQDYIYNLFTEKGKKGVDAVLNESMVSYQIQAEVYTWLARKLAGKDTKSCAELAEEAWLVHPRAYRLKWYIFRLSENGDMELAEALIQFLPQDININDAENSKITRICATAQSLRSEKVLKRIKQLTKNNSQEIDSISNRIKKLEEESKLINKERENYLEYVKLLNEIVENKFFDPQNILSIQSTLEKVAALSSVFKKLKAVHTKEIQ